MKLILATLILLGLVSPTFAADPPAKKKGAKAEAKQSEPLAPSAEAQEIAKSLTPSQKTKLMEILNKGADEELRTLPGVGPARAERIKAARPIADAADLTRVEGIGDATLGDIVAHAKAGFPEADKKEAAADKPAGNANGKKATAKKKKAAATEEAKTAKK